jgi:hypothetical protein
METYSKKHEPPRKVRKVWTFDGRRLERICGDGGEELWAFCDPYMEPSDTNHWGAVLPPSDFYARIGGVEWEKLFDTFHFTRFFSENPLSDWDDLEDGQPVLACMMESGASLSPGVFLKAGESAVFTDMDCDQIRFPSGPPMYRGMPGTPVIAPLVLKGAEK